MKNFYVSTDSTADLYAEEIKQLDLFYLPLTLTIEQNGEFTYLKDEFASYQEYVDFFNLLRKGVSVKTAMNNQSIHYEYFLSLAKSGVKDVIHFTISYGLAPTQDVANKAIEEVKALYPDFNCKVIESHTTTVGQGLLVRQACKMRDEGATLAQAVDKACDLRTKIQHYVVVDDLYHLKRGGRISGAAALIGTAAQLKVVITVTKEGKLQVIKKVMGGMKKALRTISDEYANFSIPKDNAHCIVLHTDNSSGADELAKILNEKYGITSEIRIMGPTIGCHVGPNAVAYVFISDDERPI